MSKSHSLVHPSIKSRVQLSARGAAVAAFALALLLISLPLARIGAWAQELNRDSVAGNHAEVIAQGVAPLPSGEIAWRLVEDTAEPLGEAAFEERALGFVIATDGALLLTDNPSGARTVLAPVEAAFTAEGALQARESLDDTAASYLRIGLVEASEASNGNGDEVLFAGNGFTSPVGDREIELVGVKLETGESTEIESDFEALVVVIDGQVTVGDGDVIESGEAAVVIGTVELLAEEESARVLVAVIGDEAPAGPEIPAIEDESTPIAGETDGGVGSIVVLTELCPVGVTAEQAQDTSAGDPCFGGGEVEGMTVHVTNTATDETESLLLSAAGASTKFQDLPAGTYDVIFETDPGLGETVGACGGQDRSADLEFVPFSGNSVTLDLPAEREYLCVTRTVQIEDAANDEGSLSATFYSCPEGMTFDTLDTSQCGVTTDGFDFGFQGDAEHADLHLADATLAEEMFFWGGLSVSPDSSSGVSYSPIVYSFPDGYDAYAIGTDGGDLLLPHAGGYLLTDARSSFSLVVYFFNS